MNQASPLYRLWLCAKKDYIITYSTYKLAFTLNCPSEMPWTISKYTMYVPTFQSPGADAGRRADVGRRRQTQADEHDVSRQACIPTVSAVFAPLRILRKSYHKSFFDIKYALICGSKSRIRAISR